MQLAMKPNLTSLCLCAIVLASITNQHLANAKDYDDDSDSVDTNLLTKISCKVGDKYEYMMATQSSLLEQYDANLLVKTKIELKCREKKMWLNQTNGELKNGQLFEARITSVTPMHLNASKAETVTIKSGRIQMAALFASLDNLPDSTTSSSSNDGANPHAKKPNLKVGAVNQFFTDFAKSFSELITQLFQKLVHFFENLIKKKRTGSESVLRTTGVSWQCKAKRQKRQSFKAINFEHLGGEINRLFQHPFTFLQLEDGSVKNVQLSSADQNPNVMHFKRFLAQSFATQLDERKKTVHEQSTLGDHMSHYEMEYDEPDKSKVTPEEYLTKVVHRAKRSNSHLVSVVRSVRRKDMIAHVTGSERNQYRHKTLQLADVEFDAQQVQLIEDNMLVASGGYFHSILPLQIKDDDSKQRKTRSVSNDTASDDFDSVLKKYLTMNLEYSMVKVTKNRWRRSSDSQGESQRMSKRAISAYVSKMRNMAGAAADFTSNSIASLSRAKRETSAESDIGKNVVCKSVPNTKQWSKNSQIEREDSNVIKDDSHVSDLKECFEYKEFGSTWVKAFFNRSLLTGTRRGKSLENFETKYRLGAQMLGENLFMGQIDISKNGDASKLRINLFGSEYVDLNLCDIRDKVFSQANKIPIFAENIWFMTNVGINIKYDLQFKVAVPSAVCDSADTEKEVANNTLILSRMISDQFNLHQNSKIELGGVFDASFLIFNGEMRLNGNFDMDSNIDFGQSCLSARSLVKPMNVSLDFNYKFFHPLCGEWMEDSWIPKQLSWKLHKAYRNSWFDNVCV